MEATMLMLALKGMLALGAGKLISDFVVKMLKPVDVHTKSALLDKIIDTVGNAAETVLKAVLVPADFDAVLSAVAGGMPMSAALTSLMPTLVSQVKTAVGPAVTTGLSALLGGDDAMAKRLEGEIVSTAHDMLQAKDALVASRTGMAGMPVKSGTVVVLTSGHLLVVPAGQTLPADAKVLIGG